MRSAWKIATLALMCVMFLLSMTFSVHADTATVTVTVGLFQCNDGIDNDGDGEIDYPSDDGCDDSGDDDETDPPVECNDGVDNDGDGNIDFPDDLGCDSATDEDESDDPEPDTSGGVSGGRAAPSTPSAREITFIGIAQPESTVYLLRDGVLVHTITAGANAEFSTTLNNVTVGTYLFTLYSVDIAGTRSGVLSFTLDVVESAYITVSDVFIPPTIRMLDDGGISGIVQIDGYAPPRATVEVAVLTGGVSSIEDTVTARADGFYSTTFNADLVPVQAVIKSFAVANALTSPFGRAAAQAGDLDRQNVLGDINRDGFVDLVDFSIMAFWYLRQGPPENLDINKDGIVDLIDLSILAFNWTG